MLGAESSSMGKVSFNAALLSMPLSACTVDQINHRNGDDEIDVDVCHTGLEPRASITQCYSNV